MRGPITAWVVPLALVLSACAWTRRENRPVWTAFETNLVPESSVGFAVSLPVTVPLGLLAILTDTFVAHPIQVVDDAWADSVGLWRRVDFEKAYYTESGFAPLRAIATPVWFLGSFLGRSMFDLRSPEQVEADRTQFEEHARNATLQWLQHIAAGGDDWLASPAPKQFDAELQVALATALQRGTALGRLRVYEQAAQSFPGAVDWTAAVADGSAVVRFRVLQILPEGVDLPAACWQRLLEDPEEAVRLRAAHLQRK